MDPQELVNRYMKWMKHRPDLIEGKLGESDVAHFSLPIRSVFPGREPTIMQIGTSHKMNRGMLCLPLQVRHHRVEYKNSFHDLGQQAFLEHHGISEAQVYALMAYHMTEFMLTELAGKT